MDGDDFAEDIAKIGGMKKVALLMKLLLQQAGPFAKDGLHDSARAAGGQIAADGEHAVGPAMVRAARAVFRGRAPEVAHGQDEGVVEAIAEILGERDEGVGQATVVDLRDLQANVRLDRNRR